MENHIPDRLFVVSLVSFPREKSSCENCLYLNSNLVVYPGLDGDAMLGEDPGLE
jgi:hypothetical protein